MIHYLRGSAHAIALPSASVHLVISSPPYYSKRNYQDHGAPVLTTIGEWTGQLGREARLTCGAECGECYACHLALVGREVKRVLHPTGSFWLNLGDAFDGNGGLLMAPHEVASRLRREGWTVKAVIPWVKPNGVPDSAPRRMAITHEYWVWLVKDTGLYYYDPLAVLLPSANAQAVLRKYPDAMPVRRRRTGDWPAESLQATMAFLETYLAHLRAASVRGLALDLAGDPLEIVFPTQGTADAHFATFGPRMIEPLILAGTSEAGACPTCLAPMRRVLRKGRSAPADETTIASLAGDGLDRNAANLYSRNRARRELERMLHPDETVGWAATCEHTFEPVPCRVLDPFVGTGTVAQVAATFRRVGLGVDASSKYLNMAQARQVQARLL